MFEHITREDFACKCGCGFNTYDYETRRVLMEMERWFKKPVHLNSGCRCHKHNEDILRTNPKYIPNSSRSQHLLGRAGDVWIEGIPAEQVYNYLNRLYPDKYGLGKYTTFTHLDTRKEHSRW